MLITLTQFFNLNKKKKQNIFFVHYFTNMYMTQFDKQKFFSQSISITLPLYNFSI